MDYLKRILSIIIAVIGLNLVVLVHEFGHFIFCKAFGVRTPVFSIGFGPTITSKKLGSTKFQLASLPLGGYVSINNSDLERKPYLQKMGIIFGGIIFNFLFGFLVLYYLYSKRKKSEFEEEELHGTNTLTEFLIKATPEEARTIMLKMSKNRFVGPIGIISAISQSIAQGFDVFVYFLATVSLNVGIFNLIPLSFLDGGQALYYTLESIFGRTFSNTFFDNLSYIMIALAIIFIIFVSVRDLFNLRK